MADFTNTCEFDVADGVELTQGSSGNTGGGAGDYFTTLTKTNTGSLKCSTAQKAFGNKSIRFTGASGDTAYPRPWESLNASRGSWYGHFRYDAMPGVVHTLLTVSGALGINVHASSYFQITDAAGAVLASFSSYTLLPNTFYRVEVQWDQGASTTTGFVAVRLYLAGSNTVLASYSSGTAGTPATYTVNAGTTPVTHIRFGKITSAVAISGYLDHMRLSTGTLTMPALPGAAVAPVASAGPALYAEAGTAALHLTGTGTSSDGTITSAAWSLVSGPSNPSVSTSASGTGTTNATAAADVDVVPGTYVFRLTVASSNGMTHTSDVTAYIRPAAQVEAGVQAVTAGAWSAFGGAASAAAALSDALDSTGVETVDNPSGAVTTFVLPPLGLGPISIRVRGYRTAAAGITRTLRLYKNDGTTLIGTYVQSPNQTTGDLFATPDGTTLAAIPTTADRSALVLTVTSSAA